MSPSFIQSSSYSPDSIIYKNDKEINSPESESRKQKKERLMAGLKEIYLIGGLAACSGNAAFDKRGGLGSSNSKISSAVASTLQRLLQHVLFLKQHGDCTIVIRSVSWFCIYSQYLAFLAQTYSMWIFVSSSDGYKCENAKSSLALSCYSWHSRHCDRNCFDECHGVLHWSLRNGNLAWRLGM